MYTLGYVCKATDDIHLLESCEKETLPHKSDISY